MRRREGEIIPLKRWPIFHQLETALRKRRTNRLRRKRKEKAEDNIRFLEKELETSHAELADIASILESVEREAADVPDRDDLIETLKLRTETILARIAYYESRLTERRTDLEIIDAELALRTGQEMGVIVQFPVKKRRGTRTTG